MLTTEEMQRITQEVITEKEPTIIGDEADAFRLGIEQDYKKAKSKGQILIIPGEWEVE